MGDGGAFGAPAEDRQPEGEQQILQNADVAGGHLAFDLAFPRHRRDVEQGAVREADRFEEAGEGADVADQPFRADLLIEVQASVGVEDARRIGRAGDQRQQADPQRPPEVEGGQLRRHEGMQRAAHGPAAQQVDAAAPELAGARSGQHETRRRRLLQHRMDDGEQLRDALDLVDDHRVRAGRAGDQLAQPLGAGAQGAVARRVEQVQEQGARQPVAQPRRLAGAAGAEQEAAPVGNLEKSADEIHFGSKNGTTDSTIASFPPRAAGAAPRIAARRK